MDSTRVNYPLNDKEREDWILKRIGGELKPKYSLTDDDIKALREHLTAGDIMAMQSSVDLLRKRLAR